MASPPPGGPAPEPVSDWAIVIWIILLAAATALVGTAFLPLYVGSIPLPISVLLGPIVLWWAPRAVHRLTGSVFAAVLPAAAWLITAGWLSIARNGILPGQPYAVHDGQWRVMLLLGLGALTGAAALSLIWGEHVRRQVAASAPARGEAGGEPAPAQRRPPAG